MSIIKYLQAVVILLCSMSMYAQTQEDQQIFKAMQEELDRSMQLKLEGEKSPFLISYYYVKSSRFSMTASLGSIIAVQEIPGKSWGGVDVLLGNYDETSEIEFGGRVQAFEMPVRVDHNLIRQNYWRATDMAYKNAVMKKAGKKIRDKDRVSKTELGLKDLLPITPVTKILQQKESYVFDKAEWVKKIGELSEVFKEFPYLYDSKVTISGDITEVYMTTSEGTVLKYPLCSVTLSAIVCGLSENGGRLFNQYAVSAKKPQDLPGMDVVKKQLTGMSQDLMVYKDAGVFDEIYSGPVLFEGGGAGYFFDRVWRATCVPYNRGYGGDMRQDIPVEERFGKKVMDTRLTIKNYTSLKDYKGKTLTGAYEIDADGVVPPQELLLVENGLLRNQLNNRIPKRNFSQSTGSYRFDFRQGSMGGFYLDRRILPGVLHFTVDEGRKPESLKKELIKAAKSEGFPYAYIVRKAGGQAWVYRVDVKDGKEELKRNVQLPREFEMGTYRILDFSNKEIVSNALSGEHYSVIFPSAVLVEGFILEPIDERGGQKPVLHYPFEKSTNTK